ncbi:hypothetical protein Asppvi_008425 [Aspergillus pseudoviridinutans]|uniref:Alpha/Beta hydrolase protein n=1 Tax=Aspergillus pseudoviridinutans TaxID=1517512 RepID=A0A9P3EXZ3_9EURO|nr:uncharacterized protein Asppvi_008425 [Aspergillus pseudoviridinutans]GIJ89483.1 hypothetical protein Asppvi_008425 [Aspergillus pseudoviridinutans]
MRFLFVASLISLVQVGTAAQGSNYNVTKSFAEAHSCDCKCQDDLNNANPIDLATFGQNFDFDFYETAANFSGSKPGDLLKLQPLDPATLQINAGTTVYRIQYTSRDLDGSPVPATGFIALPYAPVKENSSTYPVVAYAHGASGIYRGCAPSNSPNLYDYNSWQLLIERGYAVVATDYAGLGNNYTLHKYISYPAQVNDIYFSMIAARKAFDILSDTWMAAGHSQGGGAVWKLAESEYVKDDKDYLGTVALAPAAKVIDMFLADRDEVISSGYLPLHAKAYQRVHPSYKLTILSDIMRDRMVISDTAQLCLDALGALSSDLTVEEHISEEGIKTDIPLLLNWQNETAPASGGHNYQPLLVLQGLNDTAVVPSVTRALWKHSCDVGNEVHLSEYPGMNHDQIIPAAAPEWLAWMDARFARQRTSGNCSIEQKRPFDLNHMELALGS